MKKLFDVKYKDGEVEKKASARINEEERDDIDSRYFVLLPFWTDEKGREHYDYITRAILDKRVFGREMEGWRFTSSIINSRLYMFDFWLLGDGTMLCNEPEENTRQYRMIPGKFDRNKEPRTYAEQTAKMMYDIVKQVYEMDRIGTLAESVGEVRKQRMNTALLMLGYESPDRVSVRMNEDEAFFNIRRIRGILENYKNMAYVYREQNESGEYSFNVDYDSIPNSMFTMDGVQMTTEETERDNAFMQEHRDWVDAVRSIPGLSNFLSDMENRIGRADPEGYRNYCNVSKTMGEILLGLNPDLVDDRKSLVGVIDLTMLQGDELKRRIRQLIGSQNFQKACEFEDRWYLGECGRVAKVVEETKGELGDRAEDRLDFLTETTLKETARRLQMSRDERAQALEEYDGLRSLYFKKMNENARSNASDVKERAEGKGGRDD